MRTRVGFTLLSFLATLALGCFEAGPATDEAETSESETSGPVCGNALVEEGEACDDGNQDDTDDCTSLCAAAACGDGFVQAGVEGCDDGNQADDDGCSATCALESCGDGVVQAGEACDDGNQADTDDCTSLCAAAACGDGFVQAGVEACDDGNQADDDACTSACVAASCGDGFVQMGVEPCDDGNQDDTDGCLSGCVIASCGDGFVQTDIEECDDGNAVGGDGCTPQCMLECGDDCWGPNGCETQGGRCIRFSCRADDAGASFCDTCMGWQEVTYDQWLNQGYCADVSARYRADFAYATACGDLGLSCCADQAACGGGDNAWHFSDGAQTFFVGPCLGCMDVDNCSYWNEPIAMPSGYTRISACERL